ncbi:MAG TPA: GNAT family N-acetyltransferase [Aliidongia sp.]|nr:GNAT family N-acetyltransferase [Aliidongia sp.]
MSIRVATIADTRAIAHIDVESWRATYAGILPDQMLVDLSERRRTAMWSHLVAYRPGNVLVALDGDSEMLGFGSCGPQRAADLPYAGEIFTLYVAPDRQGEGIGRQLLLALFARQLDCGLPSSVVWVLAQNPSRFFYERLGGRPAGTQILHMGQAAIEAVAYAWPDLRQTVRDRGHARSRSE